MLLVDNGSTDGSMEVAGSFPGIRTIRSVVNLGYAGGCNLGLENAKGEYVLLLNDDALVTPPMVGRLVEAMKSDLGVAACQPKVLSIGNPGRFDYAGAAGGEMDRFGFPFCRGRIFDTVEVDGGQYDQGSEIVWASGACCLLRMSALREVGLLDADFFAHMEEIDLQWRLRNRGYRVMAVPQAIVYHEAGSTLGSDKPMKVYLNHRNSLAMLMKNHNPGELALVLPVRFLLDMVAVAFRLVRIEPMNMLAIIRAYLYIAFHLPSILWKRRLARKGVRHAGSLSRRSIVWDYYVVRRKKFSDLPQDSHG